MMLSVLPLGVFVLGIVILLAGGVLGMLSKISEVNMWGVAAFSTTVIFAGAVAQHRYGFALFATVSLTIILVVGSILESLQERGEI